MKPTEQQRICIEETYGMPSIVSAGAGSGKTATLTNRIVYALQHPEVSDTNDIDEILAITFTNKAACELKSRIKSALQEAGRNDMALKVDGAWISTIHGMCNRILKENALDLNISPDFKLMSPEVESNLVYTVLDDVLNDEYEEELQEKIDALVQEYSRANVLEMLRTLITKASEYGKNPRDCFVLPKEPSSEAKLSTFVEISIAIYEEIEGLEKPKSVVKFKEETNLALIHILGANGSTFAPLTPTKAQELDALPYPKQIEYALSLPHKAGNCKALKTATYLQHESAIVYFQELLVELRLACARPHLQTLVELANMCFETIEQIKTKSGGVTNSDLITYTYKALTDPKNSKLREYYAQKFKLIMVDEFQDTNQMQVDMINLVAGGSRTEPSTHMCVVGDAQQSIYRFRNADVNVFKAYQANLEELQKTNEGKSIPMGRNFRSHQEVLAFIKEACEGPLGQSYLELNHGRNEEYVCSQGRQWKGLESHESEDPNPPRRINVQVVRADRGCTEQARIASAKAIARDFRSLADDGHQPSEMAVLLGAMTHAETYAKEIRAQGLPCAVTGGSIFKNLPEVQVVLNLSKALINPLASQSLLTTLTSEIFGLTAEELVRLVDRLPDELNNEPADISDEFVAYIQSDECESILDLGDYPVRTANAIRVLSHGANQVGTRKFSEIISEIIFNSGWITRLESRSDTPKAANILKALRILRQIEVDEECTANVLVQRFEKYIDLSKEAPGVLCTQGDNFVRIMTVHASKGLQFPIVAVAEASGANNRSEGKISAISRTDNICLSLDADWSLAHIKCGNKNALDATRDEMSKVTKNLTAEAEVSASVFDDILDAYETTSDGSSSNLYSLQPASLWHAAIHAANTQGEMAEHERLLYVAYTRAADCLIAVMNTTSKGAPKDDTSASILETAENQGTNLLFSNDDFVYGKTLCPVRTHYKVTESAPEHDLDWVIRFEEMHISENFDMNLVEESGCQSKVDSNNILITENSIEDATVTEREEENLFDLIPTSLPQSSAKLYPFRQNLYEGVYSASSISSLFREDNDENELASPPMPVINHEDREEENAAPATDKGTAFHALGEIAARAWKNTKALTMPDRNYVLNLASRFGLNDRQTKEIERSANAWCNCETAQRMAACAHLIPEAPFFISLADDSDNPILLQGFIDLLAFDTPGKGRALVVDYKTGTYLTTDDARREKYEIQALTYAYAVLLQGFSEVILRFVFVEQFDEYGQPEITEFPATSEESYTLNDVRNRLIKILLKSTSK